MVLFKQRIQHIKSVLQDPKYLLLAVLLVLAYIGINMLVVSYVHGSIVYFYTGMVAIYTVPFTILTIVVSMLLGVNAALLAAKIRELHFKTAGLGLSGVLFGGLAIGCPGCFFGLFPVVLSFFGITGTLAILPFSGLEFQVFAIGLLCLNSWMLTKDTEIACEIPKK